MVHVFAFISVFILATKSSPEDVTPEEEQGFLFIRRTVLLLVLPYSQYYQLLRRVVQVEMNNKIGYLNVSYISQFEQPIVVTFHTSSLALEIKWIFPCKNDQTSYARCCVHIYRYIFYRKFSTCKLIFYEELGLN